MGIPLVQVDAFTDTPFQGNPAAVCVLSSPQPEAWMQQVAKEMNLSETAFLYPEAEGFRLRWFTPAVEVDLCGHATLASSHVLWSEGYLAEGAIAQFYTRSGRLTASRQGDWITLNFPANPLQSIHPPDGLGEALGTSLVAVSENSLGYLVEVDSETIVRSLSPDFAKLAQFPVHGIIVTSRGDRSDYDFVSRFFAPGYGIAEDPVTGSAHCSLAPYWQKHLQKSEFLAYQASARGGLLKVKLEGDRVFLSGQAVTILKGELVA
jgi:PhzF family phenazine biosynthesis protein